MASLYQRVLLHSPGLLDEDSYSFRTPYLELIFIYSKNSIAFQYNVLTLSHLGYTFTITFNDEKNMGCIHFISNAAHILFESLRKKKHKIRKGFITITPLHNQYTTFCPDHFAQIPSKRSFNCLRYLAKILSKTL